MDKAEIANHPGVFLRSELEARGWTQTEFAEIIGRPLGLVNRICNGKTGISAGTAQLLGAAFDMEPMYWMGLQNDYGLSMLSKRREECDHGATVHGGCVYCGECVDDLELNEAEAVLYHQISGAHMLTCGNRVNHKDKDAASQQPEEGALYYHGGMMRCPHCDWVQEVPEEIIANYAKFLQKEQNTTGEQDGQILA